MLLALDVGNTETTLGLFEGDRLAGHWRLTTTQDRTPDEWAVAIATQLGPSKSAVRAAVLGSVVPSVTDLVCDAVERAVAVRARVVDARSPLPITLDVDEPLTVGTDRILNTLAASQLFRRDTIVVDFGTATTFDCITANGRFIGGVIMPGVRTAADSLVRRAAQLHATALTAPVRAIGRRTDDCIRSGVLWGAADAVDGLVRRIRSEWPGGGTPQAVATGGLAALVAPLTSELESILPDLTLTGLRLAAGAIGLAW